MTFGLAMALVYSAIAVVIYLARGRDTGIGISLQQVVIVYAIGFITGGAIWGALGPLTRRPLIAYVAGAIASVPFYAMAVVLMMPEDSWWPERTLVVLIASGVVGGGVGLIASDSLRK